MKEIITAAEIGFGLLTLLTGLLALKKNRQNLINQTFIQLVIVIFCWSILYSTNCFLVNQDIYITDIFYILSECILLLTGIILVYFSSIFPGRTKRKKSRSIEKDRRYRIRFILYILTGLTVIFSILSFTDFYIANRIYDPVEGTYRGDAGFQYYLNRIYIICCMLLSIQEQRRFMKTYERDPRRIYSKYLIYTIFFTLGSIVLLFSIDLLYDIARIEHLAKNMLLASSAYFIYSILAYRAVALRSIIYRNAVLLLTSLLLLLPVFFLINYLLAVMYASSLYLLALVLCCIFILYYQLHRIISPALQHFVFKNQARVDDSISNYSSSILNLSSRDEFNVRRQLVDFLDRLYRPRFLAFYIHSSENNNVLCQDRSSTRLAQSESIPPAEFSSELLEIMDLSQLPHFKGGLMVDFQAMMENTGNNTVSSQIALFASIGAELILPFYESTEMGKDPEKNNTNNRPVIVLLIGLATGGRPFDHSDYRLLEALKGPTLLALKNQELLESVTSLQKKLEEENQKITNRLTRTLPGVSQGRSAAAFVYNPGGEMAEILEQIEKIAPRDSPVLISGETGTGKEQIARLLHLHSNRNGKAVTVNCSAIPPDLFENELFGHEKGAYTGAVEATEGLVERAKNGTLFLDEIGEIQERSQVKLLRLIQENEYERIGSGHTRRTNARFVFASNRDLEQEVKSGRFRSDLFYRISTFEIKLPPLRDRKEDIPLLIDHFLVLAASSFNRNTLTITSEAREMLVKFSWPGNVRELENLIIRSVVLSDSDILTVESLPIMFKDELDFDRKKMKLEKIMLEQLRLEKELLLEALEKSGGNQRKAAEVLQISRGSLQYRMKQHGLVQG